MYLVNIRQDILMVLFAAKGTSTWPLNKGSLINLGRLVSELWHDKELMCIFHKMSLTLLPPGPSCGKAAIT